MAQIDYTSPGSSTFSKDEWLDGFTYQLENAKGSLLSVLPIDPESIGATIEGRRSYMKLKIGDSKGQATITQGGSYPVGDDTDWAEATLTLARLAHTIEMDAHEAGLLDSGNAAAVGIFADKMQSAQDAFLRDIIRQTWGDGTGILANVASSAGSTITLDATTTSQYDRDRYLWIDEPYRMNYDVVHGTTGAQQVTSFEVTDINESTNVLTCDATMTSATSAGVVVRSGNWASGGAFRSLEFAGVQAAVDYDNTYLGINRSAAGNAFFRAVVEHASGTLRTLTNLHIHTLRNKMARRMSGGAQPTGSSYAAFANFGVWTAYHEIMAPGLRYTVNSEPDIGWGDPLPMMGIPLYQDVHCPHNRLFVLRKDSQESLFYVTAKHNPQFAGRVAQFMTVPGGSGIWFQKPASGGLTYADARQAFIVAFVGMGSKRPRDLGLLDDITEVAV